MLQVIFPLNLRVLSNIVRMLWGPNRDYGHYTHDCNNIYNYLPPLLQKLSLSYNEIKHSDWIMT